MELAGVGVVAGDRDRKWGDREGFPEEEDCEREGVFSRVWRRSSLPRRGRSSGQGHRRARRIEAMSASHTRPAGGAFR